MQLVDQEHPEYFDHEPKCLVAAVDAGEGMEVQSLHAFAAV